MNNKEKILKYLADLMDPGERERFEAELDKSDELKAELALYRDKLDYLNSLGKIESNRFYFENLFNRLELKRKNGKSVILLPKYAAIFFILAFTLSIFIFMNRAEKEVMLSDTDISYLISLNGSESDRFIDTPAEIFGHYPVYLGSESVESEIIERFTDQNGSESLWNIYESKILINELSDDEIEDLIEKIENSKWL